jgi:Putative zinc-finger
MTAHIGDDAESYALGLLEPETRSAIDAHVATCHACLRQLGEAEETAAMLAGALPRATPSAELTARFTGMGQTPRADPPTVVSLRRRLPSARPGWLSGLAVAAAFVVALGTSWYQNGIMRGQLRADDLAFATIANSHFLHASLSTTAAGDSLIAKVLYARDGSWLYVIVDRGEGPFDVSATIDGRPWAAGHTVQNGDTSTLFIRPTGRPASLQVKRDGMLLARVALTY